jgi:hypothetical protein
MIATMPLMRLLSRAAASALAWVAFTWMGVAFILFVVTAGADIVRALAAMISPPPDAERRQWIARAMAATVGTVGAITSFFAARTALRAWTVRTVRVPIAGLPAALQGMTLVQLTDIHVGPTIGRGFIEALVREVNALSPDVIAITGDLVDGSVAELAHHVAPLGDLRARHGVYFVTGNHEYYSGVDAWIAELTRLGVRVLANERVAIGHGDDTIDLAGVHDWSARRGNSAHKPDLARALAARDTTRPLVLLAHQPKQAHEAVEKGVSLMLSGHTHGGQLWPWTYLVGLDQPYVRGLHRKGATHIYVSEGTGYWGPPMRLGSEPEITRIVLERA